VPYSVRTTRSRCRGSQSASTGLTEHHERVPKPFGCAGPANETSSYHTDCRERARQGITGWETHRDDDTEKRLYQHAPAVPVDKASTSDRKISAYLKNSTETAGWMAARGCSKHADRSARVGQIQVPGAIDLFALQRFYKAFDPLVVVRTRRIAVKRLWKAGLSAKPLFSPPLPSMPIERH
jgi:hypothetical protein